MPLWVHNKAVADLQPPFLIYQPPLQQKFSKIINVFENFCYLYHKFETTVSVKKKIIACELLVISIIAIASFAVQHLVGDIPVELFSFPLNILIIALWLAALVWLYRARHTSRVTQSLLSMRATILALLLMVALGILFGLQHSPKTSAWPTATALLFILSHLSLITLRGLRDGRGKLRIRFILNHLGLILALGAGFWGAADREELRVVVERDMPTNIAYTKTGSRTILDYEIVMTDFAIEYFDTGTPSSFEASVVVDNKPTTLRVNHPYNRTWTETIYLISYDTEQPAKARYCIVEVVREPWRWLTVAGILMLIMGAILMFIQGKKRG